MDLNLMKFCESAEFDQMRRLSTASCPSSSSNCYTVWKYFCRDHFGWREYSEVWPPPSPGLLLPWSPKLSMQHTLNASMFSLAPLQTLREVTGSSCEDEEGQC